MIIQAAGAGAAGTCERKGEANEVIRLSLIIHIIIIFIISL